MSLIEKILDADYQPIYSANPVNPRERNVGLICAALCVLLMVVAIKANAAATVFY